jgi:hypothetical protein
MRRLSAGGVPLLLMCYFLSAALCPFCCLPGRAEAAQPTSRQSSSADQLQHSKKLTGKWTDLLAATQWLVSRLPGRCAPVTNHPAHHRLLVISIL